MGNDSVTIRRYAEEDFEQVLSLLRNSLAGWKSLPDTWFQWKHFENPAGKSILHVAEADGDIIGFRSFMKWNFRFGNDMIPAVRGADAAVAEEYRRRGIWKAMTSAQIEDIPASVDLAFSYGHRDTRAGYKKIGWQSLGTVRKGVIPRRLDRIVASKLTGNARDGSRASLRHLSHRFYTVEQALNDDAICSFIARLEQSPMSFLSTRRDLAYLKWRYSRPPGRNYFVSMVGPKQNPSALVIFQSSQAYGLTETEVVEMLAEPRSRRPLPSALAKVFLRSGGDYVAMLAPHGHLRRLGKTAESVGAAIRLGHGNEFLYTVMPNKQMNPTACYSWSFSLGDFDPEF